jgi:signal transduction histidine kinase
MPYESSEGNERIRREARVVGLRTFSTPSLEAVERRRMQLWVLSAMLLISVAVAVALLSLWPATGRSTNLLLSPRVLRLSIVCLAVAFSAYAIEKEMHLGKLARMLMDERVLTAALTNRLREVTLLLEAGKAINAVLEASLVLDTILRSAVELLGGTSGSVMLIDGDELVTACAQGNVFAEGRRLKLGQGIAGRVAVTREALLIDGRADPEEFPGLVEREVSPDSALSVPLVSRDQVLGVLNVNAVPGRVFTEYELRALNLFAEQAAVAVMNSRLFEAERAHVSELLELDRLKSDFVALVSHELRTPITSIIAAAATQRSMGIEPHQEEMAQIIERQASRLHTMVEDLLSQARLENHGTLPPAQPVDVAAVARLSARDFAVSGRIVEVDGPERLVTLGDPEAMRRVIDNLVENAHKYGAPPIRLMVEEVDHRVQISVLDAGPGIPEADRERVFERFHRLGGSRSDPGLGLGLSIVRGLVRASGGEIRLEEAPGGGTAVRVSMPLYEEDREPIG